MTFTFQEVERVKEQFVQEYFLVRPYSEYINMCATGKFVVNDKLIPINEDGEWRIFVGLCKSLPQDLSLPTEYHGVKVVVQVIGEILPL